MPRLRRDTWFTIGFALLALAIAFWQIPGISTSDTKIDLHVDPGRFLGDVASTWSPTSGLGEVQSAQYGGYLWPMAPFFALLHQFGISSWVVQRLWFALVLFLGAWGMLLLLDRMVGRPRGVIHLVATAVWTVNPYTTVFTARTTITLLGYAALPWLLLCVHQGVRHARGWRAWWWPAAFALVFMSTGGGVNAAVVFYMAIGPVLLILYEPATKRVSWRAAGGFFLRSVVLATLASLWWISALLVHVQFGIDFLQYTEQPRTIWDTNAITESLRLMGYWTSYLGAGYPRVSFPYFSDGATLLYNVGEVAASLFLPALAVLGLLWARRRRYGAFFVLMLIAGVVVMSAGFPDGTPLRSTMDWIYYHIFVSRFLRTVDKAAPLAAFGIACLIGVLAQEIWVRLRRAPAGLRLRRAGLVLAPTGLVALLVFAALPLFQGKAIDRQITWKAIPSAWRDVGRNLDQTLPANSRAIVLPGQIFDFYRWGGTVDPILPRLTNKPVAVRYETPYSDLHADDLLLTIDNLVQQARLFPGELKPLLGLIGARSVVSATDDDVSRSGAVDPAVAARALDQQGLGAAQPFGPSRVVPPAPGDFTGGGLLPQVRQYRLPPGRGIVHLDNGPATIVDGSAAGLADLAAMGGLPATAPIFYAGDETTTQLRNQAASGAQVVVTDSDQRQYFLPQYTQQDAGPVFTTGQAITVDEANTDPFAKAGTDAETVAILRGARYLRSPYEYGLLSFPDQQPIAAFDGDPRTAWVPFGESQTNRWLEVGFTSRRTVPYIDVLPLDGPHGIVRALQVNDRRVLVHPGWNHIPVGGRPLTSLRIRIAQVTQPHVHGGPAGLSEIRIPGVSLSEVIRAPIVTGRALAGRNLSHTALTYLFSRLTDDDPFRRDRYVDQQDQGYLTDRLDQEANMIRAVFAPASRRYRLDAWVQPAVTGADSALDRLAGASTGGATFTSSARYHDIGGYRASSAFDGDPQTAWVSLWIPESAPQPWLSWTTRRPLTVSRLRLTAPRLPIRSPTSVRLSWPGGSSGPLGVGPGGMITLPAPVRARSFRLTVLAARFPPGLTARQRGTRAVGIASLAVPGLPVARVPLTGALQGRCGDATVLVAGHPVPLRATGTISALDAGTPLQAVGCGSAAMPGGIQYVQVQPGQLAVDLLRLRSAAPAPLASAASPGGAILATGKLGRYSLDGVRLSLPEPQWLVLGESYDQGWQASCDGHSLGSPRVIDGYANGWLAPAGCHTASFTFGPQAGVNKSYVISAIVVALLSLLLLLSRPGRSLANDAPEPRVLPPLPLGPLPWGRAVALAATLAIPLGFVFAWRAGIVAAVCLALLFRRGVTDRGLTLTVAGLLGVVVPIAYLISQPENKGGYNFDYGVELIYAHWIGVAAMILLMLAGWLVARADRRRSVPPDRPAPPARRWPRRPFSASHEDTHHGSTARTGKPHEEAKTVAGNQLGALRIGKRKLVGDDELPAERGRS